MSSSIQQAANTEVGETMQNKCDSVALGASRISDLDKLQQYTTELSQHASSCEGSIVKSDRDWPPFVL